MSGTNIPVDVICVCSADGMIRPLRFRLEQDDCCQLRIDIDEIISTQSIHHTGAEAQIYRCRAVVADHVWMFDLKYLIRSHRWCLSQRLY